MEEEEGKKENTVGIRTHYLWEVYINYNKTRGPVDKAVGSRSRGRGFESCRNNCRDHFLMYRSFGSKPG